MRVLNILQFFKENFFLCNSSIEFLKILKWSNIKNQWYLGY